MEQPVNTLERFATTPRTVSSDSSVAEAARLMEKWHVGALVVTEGDRPVGMVTDRDLALRAIRAGFLPAEVPVTKCASRPLFSVGPDATTAEATARMRKHRVRRLAVIDDAGTLVGVVSADDLLRTLGSNVGKLASSLQHEFDLESDAEQPSHATFGPE